MLRLSQAAAPLNQGRFVPVWREYAAACLQRARLERSRVGDGDELVERRRELCERVVEGLEGALRRDGEDERLLGAASQTSTVVLSSSGLQ